MKSRYRLWRHTPQRILLRLKNLCGCGWVLACLVACKDVTGSAFTSRVKKDTFGIFSCPYMDNDDIKVFALWRGSSNIMNDNIFAECDWSRHFVRFSFWLIRRQCSNCDLTFVSRDGFPQWLINFSWRWPWERLMSVLQITRVHHNTTDYGFSETSSLFFSVVSGIKYAKHGERLTGLTNDFCEEIGLFWAQISLPSMDKFSRLLGTFTEIVRSLVPSLGSNSLSFRRQIFSKLLKRYNATVFSLRRFQILWSLAFGYTLPHGSF